MKNTKTTIQAYNPVDGQFFLVLKPDSTMLGKAFNLQDAQLIAASYELLEAAKIAEKLCELITKWADAEPEEAFGIMDEIVAIAQDETQPSEAVKKAEGVKP